jgi:hypothetical protein
MTHYPVQHPIHYLKPQANDSGDLGQEDTTRCEVTRTRPTGGRSARASATARPLPIRPPIFWSTVYAPREPTGLVDWDDQLAESFRACFTVDDAGEVSARESATRAGQSSVGASARD